MRIHSNLATASELKGMGATKGQIQTAKSGWRSVELDPSSSKHQVKRAKVEQARITRLLRGASPSYTNGVSMSRSDNAFPPGQGPRLIGIYLINPEEGPSPIGGLESNIPREQRLVEVAQTVHQVVMPIFARMRTW